MRARRVSTASPGWLVAVGPCRSLSDQMCGCSDRRARRAASGPPSADYRTRFADLPPPEELQLPAPTHAISCPRPVCGPAACSSRCGRSVAETDGEAGGWRRVRGMAFAHFLNGRPVGCRRWMSRSSGAGRARTSSGHHREASAMIPDRSPRVPPDREVMVVTITHDHDKGAPPANNCPRRREVLACALLSPFL